jgi:peptidoglycan-associated lipoprotein
MKLTDFTKLLVLGLILTVAASGCRKKPGHITPLPQASRTGVQDAENAPPLGDTSGLKTENTGGFSQPDRKAHEGWPKDREIFKSDMVHFDFDSSVVRAGEKSKVSAVADYLKANSMDAVEIEGHCDERGTEEYNRSLGERRALALREQLVSLGVDPGRIDTISYGKDRPADPGHDETAWKQNRRGEFILETPPK